MKRIRWRDAAICGMAILTLTVILELIVRTFDVPTFLVPAPSAVVAELVSRYQLYLDHAGVTLYETVLGFALATVVGVSLAVMIVYSRLLQTLLYPILLVFQIIPKVAIAPLLLVWFGFGTAPKVVVALMVAFFPIVVDSVTGLRAVDEEMLDLVRVLKGRTWQEFSRIRFPYALPFIFSGLKVAITLAVVGAVIAEFVGGSHGLGFLIVVANTELRMDMAFASLTVLSIMGILLYGVIALMERLLVPWSASGGQHVSVETT